VAHSVFTIVDETSDDDSLYPVLSEPGAAYPVETTPSDGNVAHVVAINARVLEGTGSAGLAVTQKLPPKLKWDVLITDERVIVYCTKFDKGGGWWGTGAGALIAVTANVVSKARAAYRRKGKVLVGQIRYPWIKQLLAHPKAGWKSNETIRIAVDGKPGGDGHRYMILELTLPSQVDALSVSHAIATRAARFRLAHDPKMSDDERANFEAIANGPRKGVENSPGSNGSAWAIYSMPTSYRVNRKTARLRPTVDDQGGNA